MTEHEIQKSFFEWLSHQRFEGVELIHAVPNGGARHPAVAKKLKAEGVKAGVPDVSFPAARGGYIGLAIEFKSKDGNPSKEQRERITKMQLERWCVIVCWDWQAAARAVEGYVGMMRIQL
jgi:hypothetical protein